MNLRECRKGTCDLLAICGARGHGTPDDQSHSRIPAARINYFCNGSITRQYLSTIDGSALHCNLRDYCGCTTVRHLPGVHAKVYVADEDVAIVTSANLTAGGLYRNFEYGLELRSDPNARAIKRDVLEYGALVPTCYLTSLMRIAKQPTSFAVFATNSNDPLAAKFGDVSNKHFKMQRIA